MATSLPIDVIYKILVLLPIKTLQRFKCTCKLWVSTIESRVFIKDHLDMQIINQEKKILLAKVYDYDDGESYYSTAKSLLGDRIETNPLYYPSNLPNRFHESNMQYVTCNGLVFMAFANGSMILWNPATRKHHRIPPYAQIYGININGPTFCFGYDSAADDYKILRVGKETHQRNIIQPNRVDMYSVNNGSWRNTGLLPSEYEFHRYQDPVMFKGAFHFLSENPKRKDDGSSRYVWNEIPRQICSYCLVQETFIKIWEVNEEANRRISHYQHYVNLCVFKEKLSLTGFLNREQYEIKPSRYEIWSIMNYEENTSRPCWSQVLSISFKIPRVVELWFVDSARFIVNKEMVLMMILSDKYEYLILDTRKQEFHKIMVRNRVMAFDYLETLVSPAKQ